MISTKCPRHSCLSNWHSLLLPCWKTPAWLKLEKQQKIMRKRKHHFLVWPPPPRNTHTPLPQNTEQSQQPGNTLTRSQENQKQCWDPHHAWDSELDLGSQYKWQAGQSANISLKDHQAEPRVGVGLVETWGRSPTSVPMPFWGPPVAGWQQPPPPQEKRSLGALRALELQAEESDGGAGRAMWTSLPVAYWSEQSWTGLSSNQFSVSVLVLMPWSVRWLNVFYSFLNFILFANL